MATIVCVIVHIIFNKQNHDVQANYDIYRYVNSLPICHNVVLGNALTNVQVYQIQPSKGQFELFVLQYTEVSFPPGFLKFGMNVVQIF